MKRTILLIAFIATVGNVFAQNMAEILKTRLDAKYKEYATLYKCQGLSTAVVFSDGSVWKYAEGRDEDVNVEPGHLFEFASNTKTMTAALIFKLQEEGKLNINDTIYKHIKPLNHVPSGITIKHLLQHTSGLFEYTFHPDFYNMISATYSQFVHPDTIFSYMKAPYDSAGKKWKYCNTGYSILGKVIEAVAGKSYPVVLREKILTPLKLKHTFVGGFERYNAYKIGGYINGRFYRNEPVSFLSTGMADGSIVSTSEDMATWCRAFFASDFLSPASKAQVLEVSRQGSSFLWATGCNRSTYKQKHYWGHGGTSLFFHSSIQYSESGKYAYAAAVNSDDDNARLNAIEVQFLPWLDREIRLVSTPSLAPQAWSVYPNPSSGKLNIKLPEQQKWEKWEISDLSGRTLLSGTQGSADIAILNQGVYLLKVYNRGKVIGSKKVIRK